MSFTVLSQAPARNSFAQLSTRRLLGLWILAGFALGFSVGRPPVQRTQEARVLETARQMRGTGWRGWLIPRINGNLRLQKPPLAYWMAAIAYDIAGVGTTSGRMPTVIFGWLTLGVTFVAARRAFGQRAALYSAGCLLCSYLFFRHDRLAETDAPSALFATFAIYAWWRALDASSIGSADGVESQTILEKPPPWPSPGVPGEGKRADPPARSYQCPNLWWNLGAAGTALAIMFKGGPGAYPPTFLIAMIVARRQWSALRDFAKSGAWLLLLLLAAPWFLYAKHATRTGQFSGEVDTLFSGQDHFAPFYHYLPEILKAAAPWSAIVIAAVALAIWELRPAHDLPGEQRPRILRPTTVALIWAASVLIPLCCIGNKQFHYLLPLMPPLMILTGWLLDRASNSRSGAVPPVVGALIDGTMFFTIVTVPAVLWAAKHVHHHIGAEDWAVAGGILIAIAIVTLLYAQRGRAAALSGYLIACLVIFPPVVGVWVPSLEADDSVAIAQAIHGRYGDGPYVFYGPNYSLPLCFNLRAAIPSVHTAEQLRKDAMENPKLVVIAQTKGKAPPPLPDGFVREMKLNAPGQVFEVYRVGR